MEAVKQSPAPAGLPSTAAYRNLVVATIGFGLTFWAWNLIAPLAGDYKERLGLIIPVDQRAVSDAAHRGARGRPRTGRLSGRSDKAPRCPAVVARPPGITDSP